MQQPTTVSNAFSRRVRRHLARVLVAAAVAPWLIAAAPVEARPGTTPRPGVCVHGHVWHVKIPRTCVWVDDD